MNIKQAKIQVKNAIMAYRTKDKYGRPMLPLHKQRPVFLIGAPGIGKTAIMEQIAQEMGIALVSYSITHHTRQSALGLPYISEKEYEGKKFRISEYTMSEIIASIYKKMEETGLKEGILFLDEINCVSETLTPAMLQFLQYKVFGQHKVPEGWIVVTAGNPPEYNQSVREFDMVTQDRLKRIEIEPDYMAWKEWAVNEEVEPCILNYLDIRKDDFYRVENTIDGRSFVTPRGWADLSNMIKLYKMNHIKVDELLIRQYLQNEQSARQFAAFYDLWQKYESDYRIQDILDGKDVDVLIERAEQAPFDERVSLIGLLLDAEKGDMKEVVNLRALLSSVKKMVADVRNQEAATAGEYLLQEKRALEDRVRPEKRDLFSEKEQMKIFTIIEYLKELLAQMEGITNENEVMEVIKESYVIQLDKLKKKAEEAAVKLKNIFSFIEQAYGNGPEMLLVVTELTSSEVAAKFISQYGSEEYFKYNKELLFYERNKSVLAEIDELV